MVDVAKADTPGADAEAVANAVLETFDALPAKFKPRVRGDNAAEWVPLSGVVLTSSTRSYVCVSLATGMKCLPKEKVKLARGTTIHDSHAEILALRAFNCFLINECQRIAQGEASSWVETVAAANMEEATPSAQYRVRGDVHIDMYCSEAPCGDASMELTMAEQTDDTPWTFPSMKDTLGADAEGLPLHGRGYFSQLGVVRTKPSRADASPTLSKSCTDKLALKQCLSVLTSVAALLIAPTGAYIRMLVVPQSQYVATAAERAFGPQGRLACLTEDIQGTWVASYRYRPFQVAPTAREFTNSKRSGRPEAERIASNISAIWTPVFQELLINGTLQGRKQFDPRGASRLSRRRMWKDTKQAAGCCDSDEKAHALQSRTYGELKASEALQPRNQVKEDTRRVALRPWVCNTGDESFSLHC